MNKKLIKNCWFDMKKFWLKLKIFIKSFVWGMKNADKTLISSNKDNNGSNLGGIEEHNETHSVYSDLLKGEVTQEVKELRHSMYYVERKSNEYAYGGNGRAIKRNDVFNFNGDIDKSDGYKIEIVQENKNITASLNDCGINKNGDDISFSDDILKSPENVKEKNNIIKIKRDFIPSFKLEDYATQIVVKKIDDESVLLDVYVYEYPKQFDINSRMFVKAIEKIYMGDKRSDIIEFDNIGFITLHAYGEDDFKQFEYDSVRFIDIIKYNGAYVLKFTAKVKVNGFDLIAEFYDETMAKKYENHEAKKNPTINVNDVILTQEQENYDTKTAANLLKELKNDE